ncbi:unnamed protein product [Owenia fusiformis]|uniref:Dynein light chain n=1 Tax=Owenia fusiformis TaxID=6347 RepID=A0A8J1TL93_OWEFU|nr:unnamed protein product [Owenia fusiformis]
MLADGRIRVSLSFWCTNSQDSLHFPTKNIGTRRCYSLLTNIKSVAEAEFVGTTKRINMETRPKAEIKTADMSENMQCHAIYCAIQAMRDFYVQKDIAAYIKNEFDTKFGPTWHCIVGRKFGSYVTYEHYIHFNLDLVDIFLFKFGEMNALRKCMPEINCNDSA